MDLCGEESRAEPGRQDRPQNTPARRCFFPPSLHPMPTRGGQRCGHVPAAHRDCPALTMRTLSLGSSSARLSSSSTTSQFSSPHLAKGKGLWPRALGAPRAPGAGSPPAWQHFGPEVWAKVATGVRRAQVAPPSPRSAPHPALQHPWSHFGHLLLDEVLCFLPGEEDPGAMGQR